MEIRLFDTIEYLASGSVQQQHAYTILLKRDIMRLLAPYNPILAGTFPLDITVDDSDLDILCEVYDLQEFATWATHNFGMEEGFSVCSLPNQEPAAVVVVFFLDGIQVELFAQGRPTKEQHAYRHMCIEYKLLQLLGADFRKKIIALKAAGIKTEPAFAQLLQIDGDPYMGMLDYKIEI